MSIGCLPNNRTKYHVYAMLCQDGGGPLYVKFGRTRDLDRRLSALRTGSPIPAKYFAFVETRAAYQQIQVEKGLHHVFAGRKTNGEWFRFDASSPSDKDYFNNGCVEVFLAFLGPGRSWEKISISQFDRIRKRQKAAYLNSRGRRKADAKRAAWKELENY